MSPTLRQVARRLGKSGIASVAFLLAFILFYLTGKTGWAALCVLPLLPLGAFVAFRVFRAFQRRGLWSVRNRLLFVYGLIGVLPLLLVFILLGLGTWAVTNELAIYLATSALDQRVKSLQHLVETVHRLPADQQAYAAPEILMSTRMSFPGLRLYIDDKTGSHRFPADCPEVHLSHNWKNVNGLAVVNGQFFNMAHFSGDGEDITALAPLSDSVIENLVPDLGSISLIEVEDDKTSQHAESGALRFTKVAVPKGQRPEYRLGFNDSGDTQPGTGLHLPPAAFRFDIPVLWPATLTHYHLDHPDQTYGAVVWIYSRPSAVLGKFFSGTEFLRTALFNGFIAIALLFLLVELGAVFVGARLARRLTRAVNALYEGTRRVIHGDFAHRIPVLSNDQLGELAGSFNQMTGNLERLLVVEKERERLQTELEIAREVQGQLYPKQAPPTCGLKLTVQCDPARMVSGDYYDYQELGGKRLVFAIGDVAGKGISAALLMATLQAALRAQLTQYLPLADNDCSHFPEIDVANLVSILNKQLFAHTSPEKYATFFFALFDEETRTLTYTNAGHLSPLLFRQNEVTPLESNGMVVGAFPFARYDESCLTLEPGDLLVCYTDGITEPENAYGEEFGEARLIDLVRRHAHRDDSEIVDLILDAVRDWTGAPELHDDMTLLIARQVQTNVALSASRAVQQPVREPQLV